MKDKASPISPPYTEKKSQNEELMTDTAKYSFRTAKALFAGQNINVIEDDNNEWDNKIKKRMMKRSG